MEGLLGQLGIDWKLFLSQAFNFFILLVILTQFVYKPILAVIKERNKKIADGLEKAREAQVRLHEVDTIAKEKLKEAEAESMTIIKKTEERAKELEQVLQTKAEEHHREGTRMMEESFKRQQEEARMLVLKEAAGLVKRVLVKTVELQPDAIDEALIKKAVEQTKETRKL